MAYEDLDNAVAAYKQSLDVRQQAATTKADAESALAAAQANFDAASQGEADAVKSATDAKDALVQAATALL